MQTTIDILTDAADDAGVFEVVYDEEPSEFSPKRLPGFVTQDYEAVPDALNSTIYAGTADYSCYIVGSSTQPAGHSWSDVEGFVDTYLKTLFAKTEAEAARLVLVPPFRRYKIQVGSLSIMTIEFTIQGPFEKEYV